MKAGVHRITRVYRPEANARRVLVLLRAALVHARQAGSCYTAARIQAAISSAKGAVRAAGYRQRRKEAAFPGWLP